MFMFSETLMKSFKLKVVNVSYLKIIIKTGDFVIRNEEWTRHIVSEEVFKLDLKW